MLFINKLSEVLLKWTFEMASKCVFVICSYCEALLFLFFLSLYNITLKLAKITTSIMIQPTKVRNTGVKGNMYRYISIRLLVAVMFYFTSSHVIG